MREIQAKVIERSSRMSGIDAQDAVMSGRMRLQRPFPCES